MPRRLHAAPCRSRSSRPEVRVEGAEVKVRVAAPSLVPGLPAIPVSVATALDPAAGTP